MEQQTNGVRMKDIARELGVSTVTVSKALAGRDGVGAPLRKAIQDKAAACGYRSTARGGVKGMTDEAVGLLIGEKYLGETSFYWLFLLEITRLLRADGMIVIPEFVTAADVASCATPQIVASGRVRGVIVLGQLAEPWLENLAAQCPASVWVDFYSKAGGRDCVASNNFQGSYLLTKELIAAGHSDILFIGNTAATTSILDRFLGYAKAMMEAGLESFPAMPDRKDDNTGYSFQELPSNYNSWTAFICNNDQLAGDVVRALRRKGLSVPEDFSVVSFDTTNPQITGGIDITSLELNVKLMCKTAVKRVRELMDNPASPGLGNLFIDGQIVEKGSIAAPRGK
jgi:LacI family transcriptional regulator